MGTHGMRLLVMPMLLLFAQAPSSSNFTLKAYDVGTGGGSGSSATYKLNATAGSQTGAPASSATYGLQSGEKPTQQANVPPAPTFSNPSSEYRRLQLVLQTGSNPSDTLYAIAISSDAFVTTQYVKADQSIGSALVLGDYQTYASWGGASGFWITGLSSGTTYDVKVKAMQGNFSETGYGPIATAATVQPTISFSVETTLNATPPLGLSLSTTTGVVVAGSEDAIIGLTSNAMFGGNVYVRGQNGGLASTVAAYTLPSATTDLASAQAGYGAQVQSVSEVSGGPFAAAAPYNGAGDNVGAIGTSFDEVLTTASRIDTGSATVRLKAKTDITTPAANDYGDTLLFIAAMTF